MALNAKKITHVCLDADDTLWQNEPHFRRTEREFYALLKNKLSKKDAAVYRAVFQAWNVKPEHILMVGNSLKSDVLPAVEAGAQGVWIPCADNWKHEETAEPENPPYLKLTALTDLLTVLL